METKKEIDELISGLTKLSEGEKLEYFNGVAGPFSICCIADLIYTIEIGAMIRTKQTVALKFSIAPSWEQWHNPDNLTPEQVGVQDGWRLLLVSELDPLRDTRPCKFWLNASNRFSLAPVRGEATNQSYRVLTREHAVGSLKPKKKDAWKQAHPELAEAVDQFMNKLSAIKGSEIK